MKELITTQPRSLSQGLSIPPQDYCREHSKNRLRYERVAKYKVVNWSSSLVEANKLIEGHMSISNLLKFPHKTLDIVILTDNFEVSASIFHLPWHIFPIKLTNMIFLEAILIIVTKFSEELSNGPIDIFFHFCSWLSVGHIYCCSFLVRVSFRVASSHYKIYNTPSIIMNFNNYSFWNANHFWGSKVILR